VQVPYHKFRQKLKSKCELLGIRFDDSHSEAYTSRVDALNLDPICKPPYGRKRRVKRGLYRSALDTLINADVNDALNYVNYPALKGGVVDLQPCGLQTPIASPLR